MPTFAPAQTDLRCAASVGHILRDPQYLRGLADRQTLVVCSEESRLLPGGEDAARGVERRAGDVGDILAAQWELDRRSVNGAVPGLVGEPQHGMGDAAFGALGREPRTRSCTSCRRLPMMRMTLTPICGLRWIRSSSSASLQLASSVSARVMASAG